MPKPNIGQPNWGDTLNAHLDSLARWRVTDAGVTGDDITNDAAALQAIVNARRDDIRANGFKNGNEVRIPAGTYNLGTTGLVIPPYVKAILDGTVVLRYSGTGTALTIAPLADDPATPYAPIVKQQWTVTPMFQGGGLVILGPGATNYAGCAGIGLQVGPNADIGPQWASRCYSLDNVSIMGFGGGLYLTNQRNYIGQFNNVHIEGNVQDLLLGSVGQENLDSGENFRFNDCTFAGASSAIAVRTAGWDVTFNDCSFDFCDRVATILRGYGSLRFIGGHMEGMSPGAAEYGTDAPMPFYIEPNTPWVNLHFEAVTTLINPTRPFFSGPAEVTGSLLIRPAATLTPAGFYAAGTTPAADLVNTCLYNHRPVSPEQNLVPVPRFESLPDGAVDLASTTLGWAFTPSSVSVSAEVIAATYDAGPGKLLRVNLPAGGSLVMTAAHDIPFRSRRDAFAGAIARSFGGAGKVAGSAVFVRPDGTTAVAADTDLYPPVVLGDPWTATPWLTPVVADANIARFAAVRPRYVISNPTGATISVDLGLLYFGR